MQSQRAKTQAKPKSLLRQERLCTERLEATACNERRRTAQTGLPIKAIRLSCITDPDPNMDMQRVHVRNMRSKCRYSYVLQFTLRLGASSVLHRPLSQMIHCMVLFLRFARRYDALLAGQRPRFTVYRGG